MLQGLVFSVHIESRVIKMSWLIIGTVCGSCLLCSLETHLYLNVPLDCHLALSRLPKSDEFPCAYFQVENVSWLFKEILEMFFRSPWAKHKNVLQVHLFVNYSNNAAISNRRRKWCFKSFPVGTFETDSLAPPPLTYHATHECATPCTRLWHNDRPRMTAFVAKTMVVQLHCDAASHEGVIKSLDTEKRKAMDVRFVWQLLANWASCVLLKVCHQFISVVLCCVHYLSVKTDPSFAMWGPHTHQHTSLPQITSTTPKVSGWKCMLLGGSKPPLSASYLLLNAANSVCYCTWCCTELYLVCIFHHSWIKTSPIFIKHWAKRKIWLYIIASWCKWRLLKLNHALILTKLSEIQTFWD